MISLEFANGQIQRLGGMYRFPDKYPAAVLDLAKALAFDDAVTEEIATAVIDLIIETATSETVCPMPAEIRSMTNAKLDPFNWDPNCQKCNGCGSIISEPDKDGYTYSKRCTCLARRQPEDYGKKAREQGMTRDKSLDAGLEAAAKKLRAN